MAIIQIYDNIIEERVIPTTVERPTFRVVIPEQLQVSGDYMSVQVSVNGVEVGEPIKYILQEPVASGFSVAGVVTLGFAEQPTATITSMTEQAAAQAVTKTIKQRLEQIGQEEELIP